MNINVSRMVVMPSERIINPMNNMKKEYVKPEMLVEEISPISMLATSTSVEGDANGEFDGSANQHRGAWGNLWD